MAFTARLVDTAELEACVVATAPEELGAQVYQFATAEGVEWGSLEMRATELSDKLEEADVALGYVDALPRLVFAGPLPGTRTPVTGFGFIDPTQARELAQTMQNLMDTWSRECRDAEGLERALEFVQSACARAANLQMGVLFFAL